MRLKLLTLLKIEKTTTYYKGFVTKNNDVMAFRFR